MIDGILRSDYLYLVAERVAIYRNLVSIASILETSRHAGVAKQVREGPDLREAVRRSEAAPILAPMGKAMGVHQGRVLPSSRMGQAIRYGLARWEGLERHATCGKAEIDTNSIGNAIRPTAAGRKAPQPAQRRIGPATSPRGMPSPTLSKQKALDLSGVAPHRSMLPSPRRCAGSVP
jgi:hypothetical protein